MKRWLILLAGLLLVGLGAWLILPRDFWGGALQWVERNWGIVSIGIGIVALIVGFKLIRRGMKKG